MPTISKMPLVFFTSLLPIFSPEQLAYITTLLLLLFFFFLFLFWATPKEYGGSQAMGQTGAASAAYTAAHSNARPLTHWGRPGMDTSWVCYTSHSGNSMTLHKSPQYLGAGRMRHGGWCTAATVAWPILVHGRCWWAVLAQEAAVCRKKGPREQHFKSGSLNQARVPQSTGGEHGRNRYTQQKASPRSTREFAEIRLQTHASTKPRVREWTKTAPRMFSALSRCWQLHPQKSNSLPVAKWHPLSPSCPK